MSQSTKEWIESTFRGFISKPKDGWSYFFSSALSKTQRSTNTLMTDDEPPFPLLSLPLELREQIWKNCISGNTVYVDFADDDPHETLSYQLQKWEQPVGECPLQKFRRCNRRRGRDPLNPANKRQFFDISILLVCRQIYQETMRFAGSDKFLFSANTFAFRNQCGCLLDRITEGQLKFNDDPQGFFGLRSFQMILHSHYLNSDADRLNKLMAGNIRNLRVKLVLTDPLWERLMDSFLGDRDNLAADGLGSDFDVGMNIFIKNLDCERVSGSFELNFVFTYKLDEETWTPWPCLLEKPNLKVTRGRASNTEDWTDIL